MPDDSMPRGFSYDPAYDDRDPVCPMCQINEPSPHGRLYRAPGVPVTVRADRLPRLCMECTVDTRDLQDVGF